MADSHKHSEREHKHHHFVMPNKMAFSVWGALLVLTVITVGVAKIDLGQLNIVVALAVATIKASLVGLFFMGLLYDRRENAAIFLTSFVFLAIFLVLTTSDLFFRGDVAVKGPLLAQANAAIGGAAKFKKPWVSSAELVSRGKELFAQQCVSCHGADGKGDGPAASAMTPKPRNFTAGEGWKNPRKPSSVYKVLTEGLKGTAMPPFATIAPEDRWAVAHFVLSLGPAAQADTPAELTAVGVDPSKDTMGGGAGAPAAQMAIEDVMASMAVPEPKWVARGARPLQGAAAGGASLYEAHCAECHGSNGMGGLKTATAGGKPQFHVVTQPFSAHADTVASADRFGQVVASGTTGRIMPGFGHLSVLQMRQLHDYVRGLPGSR